MLPYGTTVNQIDPSVFLDSDGQKYLYYGSFRDDGIQAVRLNEEGTAPVGDPVQVVGARRGEAHAARVNRHLDPSSIAFIGIFRVIDSLSWWLWRNPSSKFLLVRVREGP